MIQLEYPMQRICRQYKSSSSLTFSTANLIGRILRAANLVTSHALALQPPNLFYLFNLFIPSLIFNFPPRFIPLKIISVEFWKNMIQMSMLYLSSLIRGQQYILCTVRETTLFQNLLQGNFYFTLKMNLNAYLKGTNGNPTFLKYFKIKGNGRV